MEHAFLVETDLKGYRPGEIARIEGVEYKMRYGTNTPCYRLSYADGSKGYVPVLKNSYNFIPEWLADPGKTLKTQED